MSKIIQNKNLKKRNASVPEAILADSNSRQDFDVGKKAWLYRIVYSTRFGLSVVVLLLISFSLQSAERVYANENILTEPATAVEEVVNTDETQVNNEAVIELPGTEEASDIVVLEEDTTLEQLPETDIEQLSQVPDTTEVTNADETEVQEVNDEATSNPESTLDDLSSTTTSTTTDQIQEDNLDVNLGEQIDEEESNTVEVIVEENSGDDSTINIPELIPEELSTTSEALQEELIEQQTTFETVSVTESDSEFSFSKDECTQLATGSFYCLQPQQNILNDALFSGPDEDGDLEIFLIRDGVQVQVTSNLVDDAAPYFDQNSNTLVWHRLVDDVYQIISYDPYTEQELQLTETDENNMEPTRQGEYTVWQRWVDGGWNIILHERGNETQITRNNHHNVAPFIHGSLVVWNSRDQSGEKTIEMFDIKSGTYVTVDDPDGLSVSNPRMVFVYDSLHPNGDIVTKGYDVMAKKFIDLDSLPRDLPEELPPSDSTGETRALIQSKPSVKSEAEELISSSTPNILPPVPLDNASNTDEMTLDLSHSTTTDTLETEDETLTSTEFDIVVEPFVLYDSTTTNSVQE